MKINSPAPEDLLTYDAFRLWLAGLPDDYVFFDSTSRVRSCPLAKFAQDVCPQRFWVANGISLLGFRKAEHLAADVRVEGAWTGAVPKIVDIAFCGRGYRDPVNAAELRATLPELKL